eukprot:scaffold45697_cov252-Amphora_coffeaeformis.AAC.1
MPSARRMNYAVWWSMAMLSSVVAMLRDPFQSSLRHGTLSSHKCQLTPYRADQSTIDFEFEFLFATSSGYAETMEQSLIREIDDHIFDCLGNDRSDDDNVLHYDRTQQDHRTNTFGKKEWSRRAREIGIISLTVVRVSPDICPDGIHDDEGISCGHAVISLQVVKNTDAAMGSSQFGEDSLELLRHALTLQSSEFVSIRPKRRRRLDRELRKMSGKSKVGSKKTEKAGNYWTYWSHRTSSGKMSGKSSSAKGKMSTKSKIPVGGLRDWRKSGKKKSDKGKGRPWGMGLNKPDFDTMVPSSPPSIILVDAVPSPSENPQELGQDGQSSTTAPSLRENGNSSAPSISTPSQPGQSVKPSIGPNSPPPDGFDPTQSPTSTPTRKESVNEPTQTPLTADPAPEESNDPTSVPSQSPTVAPSPPLVPSVSPIYASESTPTTYTESPQFTDTPTMQLGVSSPMPTNSIKENDSTGSPAVLIPTDVPSTL